MVMPRRNGDGEVIFSSPRNLLAWLGVFTIFVGGVLYFAEGAFAVEMLDFRLENVEKDYVKGSDLTRIEDKLDTYIKNQEKIEGLILEYIKNQK